MLKLLHTLFLTADHARLRLWTAYTLFTGNCIIGSIPGARAQAAELASGMVLHSTGYSVLAFLLFTGYAGNPSQRALKAVAAVAVMGAIDEYVQSFFPYRHASVGDWVVDITSALLAASALWLLWTARKVRAA